MELTEEDIKKMSPEQLRELQKQQCIFCHIISKRVQSKIVYEDDKVTATLDINPANPGHVLLLPKEHYSVSPQIPDELMAHMGMVSKQLSTAMAEVLGAEGTTIIAANGVAAGQRASHFILHIIPRKKGDNVGIDLPPGKVSEEQLLQIQKTLAPMVAKVFGAEPVITPAKPAEKEEAAKKPPQKEAEPKKEEESQEPEEDKEEPEDEADESEDDQEKDDDKEESEDEDADDSEDDEEPEKKGPNLDEITDFLIGGGKQ